MRPYLLSAACLCIALFTACKHNDATAVTPIVDSNAPQYARYVLKDSMYLYGHDSYDSVTHNFLGHVYDTMYNQPQHDTVTVLFRPDVYVIYKNDTFKNTNGYWNIGLWQSKVSFSGNDITISRSRQTFSITSTYISYVFGEKID